MDFNHELVIPNDDIPFKLFLFGDRNRDYYCEKHWHRSVEIFAVYEGEIDFYLNNERIPLRSGEFILVNSNEIHSIYGKEPNTTVVLQIPIKTFEDYFTKEQSVRFSHEEREKDKKMMQLIKEMYDAYEKKDCGYKMQVLGFYYTMLHLMVTEYRELDVSQELVKRNHKLERLSQITAYIKENYTAELSLQKVAEVFGYSPYYLSRMFQKYAGINYKSYLQSIRVQNAYNELMNSDHTISEVAMNNGFPNSKALAKAFTKTYGMLPSEYRKKDKKVPLIS